MSITKMLLFQVSNVTKRGCLLSWKPPSDNGGHQISQYEVEKCEAGSDQWLPIKNTKGLSLEINNLVNQIKMILSLIRNKN